MQIRIRQAIARKKRASVGDVWPILESAGTPPSGWKGWPGGKQFALVLTHDVETARGVERCRMIMDLEERLGFRSAFFFVPERYKVPVELREEMVRRGFEVGVHGLRHDMTLFRSEKEFKRQAQDINRYLKEWGAVGFRSPYMIRNLDWIRDHLNIEYDTSTFDTDPFEPHPDGVGTIFPFIVDDKRGGRSGYVELPCTLPQDLNLFVLLGETGIDVWKRKLDWIATCGGMALFDTHPDYMQGESSMVSDEYPMQRYEEFLEHLRIGYTGRYWHALSRDVSLFWRHTMKNNEPACRSLSASCNDATSPQNGSDRKKEKVIWVDLDNTPHVPFFRPIIKELRGRGYEVVVTARDAFQVFDLAKQMGVECTKIGRHYGKNRIMKVTGLFFRAIQMATLIGRKKPVLAISHGSRSQIILSNILRIPSLLIEDYEFAKFPPLMRPSWRMIPEIIPHDSVESEHSRLLTYPGIKEDVYVPQFTPDSSVLAELGAVDADIIVTVRPPATEAHYHNPESEKLFAAVMGRLHELPQVLTVLLPRNSRQSEEIKKQWPQYFADGRIVIPEALDGLNLIWHSDLVVSGGGTMNREAAALGVPVYSTFRGAIGAVDRHLEEKGRLILLTSEADVRDKLHICKRTRQCTTVAGQSEALARIIAHIERLVI
jgi:predicted glycosyltransferase/peptidoglycan/xylan/chitin deacetylase (PgdA/CDA1 family)